MRAYEIEKKNEAAFKKYWVDRGVKVETEIQSYSVKGDRHFSLRSNLTMKVPEIDSSGRLKCRVFGKSNEILPRGQREYLLPVKR